MSERTGYSAIDRDHTEKAHLAARQALYPAFFNVPFDAISYQEGIEYFKEDGSQGRARGEMHFFGMVAVYCGISRSFAHRFTALLPVWYSHR
jgi:hypothetical protein